MSRHRREAEYSRATVLAQVFGAPIAAVSLGLIAWRVLPLPDAWRFVFGVHGLVPLWVTLVCVLPLLRARTAWSCCVVSLLAAVVAVAT